MSGVVPDGSPVEVYLALEPEPDLSRIRSVLPAGASVLDLGSGPGRIANVVAAAGHDVVAVDDSPEILARVVRAETVLGDVWTLDLGRRFDAVLVLSHLIDGPTRSDRLKLRWCGR
ncbi:MAG TPA: class I SAM-dependent methyltransferase [Ilumatobacteraceae bacterium]|nr:class I SAM-dependent methyltransferase [Ilumatobacteraceae bacterium]